MTIIYVRMTIAIVHVFYTPIYCNNYNVHCQQLFSLVWMQSYPEHLQWWWCMHWTLAFLLLGVWARTSFAMITITVWMIVVRPLWDVFTQPPLATMITALSIHVITLLAALTLPYAATFDYCVPHAVDASTTPPNASLLINVRALLLMQSKDDVNTNLWIVMMIMCACMIAVILDVATLTVCNDHKYSGCLWQRDRMHDHTHFVQI